MLRSLILFPAAAILVLADAVDTSSKSWPPLASWSQSSFIDGAGSCQIMLTLSETRLCEEISGFGRRVPLTSSSRLREVIGSLTQ